MLMAGYLAVGILASTLTRNQIIAAVAAFVFLLILSVAGFVGQSFQPPLSDFLSFVSPQTHADNFGRGVFGLPDLVLALSLIFVPLYLSVVALGARKWH
jgi:ABC-2 type transport system permease protein